MLLAEAAAENTAVPPMSPTTPPPSALIWALLYCVARTPETAALVEKPWLLPSACTEEAMSPASAFAPSYWPVAEIEAPCETWVVTAVIVPA